ncbi:hypothetical protein CFN78_03080 [Amycolatopsis antarctica]|uniref:SSD domain-containing protein n=1 Tax=Amycolatopsis antarctica TaxID=1854586 RepID=A0A263D9J8_9PSEU|nr:MMPL family transporter [Amycolatopsis antarctica]OZM75160.1 hypothetical protein CFN78_03080 [Amycolatopsis antarctica]
MFGRIGLFAVRHARVVLAGTLLALIVAGVLGVSVFGQLRPEGFTDPAAESSRATELLDAEFGGQSDLVVLVDAGGGTVDDLAVSAAGARLGEELATDPALSRVTSYFATAAPPLRSDDGRYALIVAHVKGDESAQGQAVEALAERHTGDRGPIRVTLGGTAAVVPDVGSQIAEDLVVAEAIAVPITAILLVVAFGSLVAALMPLAIGAIAILGTFAELSVLGSVTDVSVYAINLTTALGLALAIDYALLMVSRFREELSRDPDTGAAVVRTVETAGRTIVFSAATVAVALAVLLLFPLYFLRSFAYAGIGVIAIAMVSALLVLPALLTVLGPRINAGRMPWATSDPATVSAFWGRLARVTMRRPLRMAAPVIALLVLAATPLLNVEFGSPDDRVLPGTAGTRVVGEALRGHFPANTTNAIQVVNTGDAAPDEVADYARRLSALPGVAGVSSSAGGFAAGRSAGTTPADAALARPGAQQFTVVTAAEARSGEAQDVVPAVRDTAAPAGTTSMVGGPAAELVDSKETVGSRLPLAIALIMLTTFALLFLFTGSVLQPLRALVFNVLGLSATLGMMVPMFQQGWLSEILGFTPLPLDMNMLVLLFCIAFGLSMDYEVFVISRIKEYHELGAPLDSSVTDGLSHTGRIVSTAAALLAVSFFAFATSGVSMVQLFGIGTGLAILIDATLIRGILVPAGMRLMGRFAWWAPGPLRRLHDRIGVREASPPRTRDDRVSV